MMHLLGEGKIAKDPVQVVEDSYAIGENEEFMVPTVINTGAENKGTVDPEDGIIFFNFRPDRARITDELFCAI